MYHISNFQKGFMDKYFLTHKRFINRLAFVRKSYAYFVSCIFNGLFNTKKSLYEKKILIYVFFRLMDFDLLLELIDIVKNRNYKEFKISKDTEMTGYEASARVATLASLIVRNCRNEKELIDANRQDFFKACSKILSSNRDLRFNHNDHKIVNIRNVRSEIDLQQANKLKNIKCPFCSKKQKPTGFIPHFLNNHLDRIPMKDEVFFKFLFEIYNRENFDPKPSEVQEYFIETLTKIYMKESIIDFDLEPTETSIEDVENNDIFKHHYRIPGSAYSNFR